MSNPRFRFKRIIPRDDIDDIKDRCTHDSINFRSPSDSWNTVNQDTYHSHPINTRDPIAPQPVSVSLGGGHLAPTRDEMRSNYMNTYHAYDKKDFASIAPHIPDSQVIPRDHNIPKLSTAHLSMLETSGLSRDPNSAQTARDIGNEQRGKHFPFGFDNLNYSTTTATSYSARKPVEQPVSDGWGKRVSLSFDKNAGLGPHDKSLTKRREAPIKPDAAPFDQHEKNFDQGYNNLDYSTTMRTSYSDNKAKPPPRAIAPPCAELSNHYPHVPRWTTAYSTDFQKRAPIENQIDREELRKVHWDPGHEKNEWPNNDGYDPKSARRCPKGPNLHESNVVFRGDGEMQLKTTTGDMVGNFQKDKDYREPPSNEARIDHINVGADKTNYLTAAKEANKDAGKGRPAQPYEDYSKKRGPCYAKGGDWDQFAGKDMVDIKKYKPVQQTPRADGSYYRSAHFDLDATTNNKPRYTTTYYKHICKPTLEA